ncbi:LOW QUALITY PROTEIN: hypothetical protein J0S82_004250, partial [Galemys pyrenaicus]
SYSGGGYPPIPCSQNPIPGTNLDFQMEYFCQKFTPRLPLKTQLPYCPGTWASKRCWFAAAPVTAPIGTFTSPIQAASDSRHFRTDSSVSRRGLLVIECSASYHCSSNSLFTVPHGHCHPSPATTGSSLWVVGASWEVLRLRGASSHEHLRKRAGLIPHFRDAEEMGSRPLLGNPSSSLELLALRWQTGLRVRPSGGSLLRTALTCPLKTGLRLSLLVSVITGRNTPLRGLKFFHELKQEMEIRMVENS